MRGFRSGMLWGAFVAYLIDGDIRSAVIASLVGAVLTGFGFIHAPSLRMFDFTDPIMWGYLIMAIVVFIGMLTKPEQMPFFEGEVTDDAVTE